MDDKALLRIDSILRHIDLILSDTKDINFDELIENNLLVRATCFSISQIGKQMVALQNKIGDKYPNLPWLDARKMRNIIVHDYDHTDNEVVYLTIKNDLPLLKKQFEIIRKDFE